MMQGSRSHITLNVDDLGTHTFLFYANERGLLNMVSEKKEICSISVNVIFPLFCRALGLFACFNISPMVIMAITKVKVQISLSSL